MQKLDERARFEQIVRAVDPRATLLRTWSLKGGIASRMTVLEFVDALAQERRVVLRQPDRALLENPHTAANEFELLRLLESAGLPTPRALLLDESNASFPAPYLVIEYIDGAPDFRKDPSPEFVSQLVLNLLSIHGAGAERFAMLPAYTPRFIHQRESLYPDASLGASHIRDVLRESWSGRAKNTPTLLHGDYWPGNLLWKDDRLVRVVDWEEACIGDPLADVAIARLDLLWAFGEAAMFELTERYAAASALDFDDLPYWDLDAALRPVFNIADWAAGWTGLERPDVSEATMRAGHRAFVERAFAALAAR